jgi:hypothetical protein
MEDPMRIVAGVGYQPTETVLKESLYLDYAAVIVGSLDFASLKIGDRSKTLVYYPNASGKRLPNRFLNINSHNHSYYIGKYGMHYDMYIVYEPTDDCDCSEYGYDVHSLIKEKIINHSFLKLKKLT